MRISILPERVHRTGRTPLYSVPVPVGATWVEAHLDRRQLASHSAEIAWGLEFSDDGGATWLPWGGATTVLHDGRPGHVYIDPELGRTPEVSYFGVPLWGPERADRRVRGWLDLNEDVVTRIDFEFLDAPLPIRPTLPEHHSVAYDNANVVYSASVQSLTTSSFTIGSGINRAAVVGMSHASNGATGFSGSVGGASLSAISNTDTGTAITRRSLMFVAVAPASGSQTASMSWTSIQSACLGVVTVANVNQSAPTNNGTKTTGSTGDPSLAITSTSGDLTIDTVTYAVSSTLQSPSQTQRWNLERGAGSTGPGTGTATHSWDQSPDSSWAQSGANIAKLAIIEADGSAAGAATTLGEAARVRSSDAAATAGAVVEALGAAVLPGIAASINAATVEGAAAVILGAVGASDGVAEALGQGHDASQPEIDEADASASGSATADAESTSLALVDAAADGTSDATAVGVARRDGVGASVGLGSASAIAAVFVLTRAQAVGLAGVDANGENGANPMPYQALWAPVLLIEVSTE